MKLHMRFIFILSLLSPIASAGEADAIKSLAKRMQEITQELSIGRHDFFVRLQQAEIEAKLGEMIAQMEKSSEQNNQKNEQQKQAEKKQRREQLLHSSKKQQQPQNPGSPGNPPPVPSGPTTAKVDGTSGSWAKLPKAQRDEMMQAFGAEMPEKWKKRLEAYFVSIAAEEAKEK